MEIFCKTKTATSTYKRKYGNMDAWRQPTGSWTQSKLWTAAEARVKKEAAFLHGKKQEL